MRHDDDPDGQRRGIAGSLRDNLSRPEVTLAERAILLVGAFSATAVFVIDKAG